MGRTLKKPLLFYWDSGLRSVCNDEAISRNDGPFQFFSFSRSSTFTKTEHENPINSAQLDKTGL